MPCFVFHLAARVTGKSVIKKRRLDSDDESGRINDVSYVTLVVPVITTVPLSSSTCTVIPSLYKSLKLQISSLMPYTNYVAGCMLTDKCSVQLVCFT